jgi:hypothetical protein
MLCGKQEATVTLKDALLKALEQGPGNPRQISERLVDRVREALNDMADDHKIDKRGHPGQGNEKIYSLKPPPKIERRR